MEITNKKLEAFLKEKGVLEQYLYNYHKQNDGVSDKGDINYISSAFAWSETAEEKWFWSCLAVDFIVFQQSLLGITAAHVHGGELG